MEDKNIEKAAEDIMKAAFGEDVFERSDASELKILSEEENLKKIEERKKQMEKQAERQKLESEKEQKDNFEIKKLEKELKDKKDVLKTFERLATPEQKAEYLERRRNEIAELAKKIENKKNETVIQSQEGAEEVEKAHGNIMEIKEAKIAGQELEEKVESGAQKTEAEIKLEKQKIDEEMIKAEIAAVAQMAEPGWEERVKELNKELEDLKKTPEELFEEAQAMEVEQKFAKAEKAETILEVERLREELDAAREKFALARPKLAKTEAEIFAETLEKKGGLSPFEFGKKFVEEKPEISGEYEEARKNYESRRIAMVNFLIDTKREILEKKGLASEEIEKELDKYSKEYLAPNFVCAEAAKIQSAREEANPSFIEMMKDNKIANIIYGAVDQYRKASFKDKMLLSVGLLGTGAMATVLGGTIGSLVAGGVVVGKITQRVLSTAGTAVGVEALMQKSQQKRLEKEGWGKSRKEYIAKQIAIARGRIKAGKVEVDRDSYEHARQKMELLLSERRDLLKKLETKRTVIGASVGLLVGTGVVFRGVRYLGDIVGINERLSDFFGYKGEMLKMPEAEMKELPAAEVEALPIDAVKENIEHLEGLTEHPADAPNVSESENMIYNLVDQDKAAEYEKEMKPYIDTIAEGLKEKGFSAEEIMAKQDEIVNSVIAEMKNRGITIDESALNAENLQKIMESPEGKMGAIISKLAGIEQKNLNSIIVRMGGWDKFMNSSVSSLFEPEGGPIDISLSKFGMELKRLTGDAPSLYGAASIKEILQSINSKEIFGGSAEELIKKGM